MTLDTIAAMARYSDWANAQVINEAEKLDDVQLDQPFEMGLGSLRRTVIHIYAGESVWLARWKGQTETPWVDESKPTPPSQIRERLASVWEERNLFFESLSDKDLNRGQSYRDSKGELFSASLGDMILQGSIHSIHHRAQAVNMIRRLGGAGLEMDYMTWIRKPA